MAHAIETREQQILGHALKLFSQSGYRETSLQDVADQLGLTRPAFYYYFKSKDELLWRLIGSLGDGLLERAKPIAQSRRDPVAKLDELLHAHAQTVLSNSDAFRIYMSDRHEVGPSRDRRLRRGERAYAELVAGVIAAGQRQRLFKPGDPMVLAVLAIGLANSALNWYRPKGRLEVEQIADIIASMAVDGLLRRPSGSNGNSRPH